jgi:hypothetical protein
VVSPTASSVFDNTQTQLNDDKMYSFTMAVDSLRYNTKRTALLDWDNGTLLGIWWPSGTDE